MQSPATAHRPSWRTLPTVQRDRADQQRAQRCCTRTQSACGRAFAAAARAESAIMQDQDTPGAARQPDKRFEGLDWVNGKESELLAESRREEQQKWLTSQRVMPAKGFRHVNENEPARHRHHRVMMKCAAQGDASGVQDTLDRMQEDDNLEPGPYAYHAKVFAHIKAGQPEAGLEVMKLMHHSGLQPISQTYCAMIHGYVRAGRPDEAKDVFISMQRSGQDAYAGWLAITNQLFAAGQQELAKQLISKRQSDWLPDADLYEHIIKCVLSDSEVSGFYTSSSESSEAPQSNSHQPEKALDIVHDMQKRLAVEVRHLNLILESYADNGAAQAADTLFRKMASGQYAPPNGKSTEALARAYITSGRDDFGEGLTRVFGLVNKLQVPITKRFRALLVEGSLMQNNLQDALDQFAALRTAGRLRGMMSVLPDHVLADLLSRLSTAGMPAELLRVLRAMQADERRMPSLQPDPSGRSFLTAWLPSRLLSAASLGFEGVNMQPEAEADVTEIEGVRILDGKYAINEEGKILSPSSQNILQLKAELTARKLSTQGKRDELKRRVMAARSAEPPDMAKAIRKKEAQLEAKRKKLVEKEVAAREAVREAGKEGSEAQPAGDLQEKKSKVEVWGYKMGTAKIEAKFEAIVDDDEEGAIDEAADGAVDPVEASNAATAVDDEADDFVSDSSSAEDLLDDSLDRLPAVPPPLPPVASAVSQRLPSNENAGAEVAVQLLSICCSQGGSATAQDYEQILQAAEAEGNALVARNLARSWHSVLESAFETERIVGMYNKAAQLCMKAGATAYAQEIVKLAQMHDLELSRQLQTEITQTAVS